MIVPVIQVKQPETSEMIIRQSDVAEYRNQWIARNMLVTTKAVGELFGKGEAWVRERMQDGCLRVADEYAKVTADGVKFSNSARITAASVEEYRMSLEVES